MMVPIVIVVVRIMIVAVVMVMLVVNSTAMIVFSYDAAGSCQQRYKAQQTKNYSHTKTCHPPNSWPWGDYREALYHRSAL
jgi:hypothetical protein